MTERIIFIKSHVASHTRKDGVYIPDYINKVQKKTPPTTLLFGTAKPNPEGFHPKPNDHGKKVFINKLSKATQADTWVNPDAIAIVDIFPKYFSCNGHS